MQRIVLAWAALSLGIFASPVAAQQAGLGMPTSEQSATAYLQSVPPAPPPPRYVAPKPPPFPPMPRVQPHHRSTKAATHHSSRTSHHAKPARHRATSKRHHATSARPAKLHLSRKTIRQCHGMNYRQIMSHRYCRALMKQEIAATDHRHKVAKRHKATAHRHKTKRRRR